MVERMLQTQCRITEYKYWRINRNYDIDTDRKSSELLYPVPAVIALQNASKQKNPNLYYCSSLMLKGTLSGRHGGRSITIWVSQ